MAHVAQWKYNEIDKLTQLLTTKKVIGLAQIGGIPAPQMQQMRQNIRDIATIRSAKNTLLIRALDNAEKQSKGISVLKDSLKGQAVIIATDINPFKLHAQLKASRTKAPAKGGEILDHDLEVKAGDTPFKPGPVVGELQKVGIPAAIQEGKVIIKHDKVVVPAGQKIPADVAKMLTRLEIHPIDIGMQLNAVYEEGNIFTPDILDIDLDQFNANILKAGRNAFNLAYETTWVTPHTIFSLLQKAYHHSLALSLEGKIPTKTTIPQLLTKAHHSMLSVASQIPEGLDEELKKMVT